MSRPFNDDAAAVARKFAAVYRGIAVVGLNTLILLLAIEVLAGITLAVIGYPTGGGLRRHAPPPPRYYAVQPWGHAFWTEHFEAKEALEYDPYVLWRTAEFTGEYVNVDSGGRRSTHDREPCTYSVFLLGGSAAWGWGVPDWGTVSSYLGEQLADFGLSACVRNLGEQGFVSSQELIRLENELRRGNIPDVAIFYDGFNDMLTAWENRRAGIHYRLERIAAKLEEDPDRPLALVRTLMGHTRLATLKRRLIAPRPSSDDAPRSPTLARQAVEAYEANFRLAQALGAAFGFDVVFVWQPYIRAGSKTLTPDEQKMWSLKYPYPFLAAVDSIARERAAVVDGLHYFGDVFDSETGQMWIDFVHVTPEANRVVAERLAEIVTDGDYLH
jgi:lysophospholipase L1-like esterase